MGLVFQVPVAILAATRAGIVTPRQLRRNRRYAIVVCAAVAAFLPGDVITLVLETVPLYLLYEASILLASFVDRSKRGRDRPGSGGSTATSSQGAGYPPGNPASSQGGTTEPSVQEIIDHIDRELSD